ncbi:MAG: hypothetical protein J6A21_07955 [Lentisphaeria bacterium]|nr:hypothetical protein [Lentisphaeria bacterium]
MMKNVCRNHTSEKLSAGRRVFLLVFLALFALPVSGAEGKKAEAPKKEAKAVVGKNTRTAPPPVLARRDLAKLDREKELIMLKAAEKNIDDLVSRAVTEYRNGEFEKAIAMYLDAKKRLLSLRSSILRLEGLGGEALDSKVAAYREQKHIKRLDGKIASCNVAISRAYYYWAQAIYFDAEKSASAADFDLAISTCRKAYEIYPACKEEMEKVIARYQLLREKAAERSAVESTTSNAEEIRKKNTLMRQGEVLYSSGQFDKARSRFEQVISLDPYNEMAIDYLRRINHKLSEMGRRRRELVHSERIVEAGWEALTPIIAYDDSGASGILNMEGVEKTTVKSPIQNKLSSIMLPHGIDFPDSPLSAVITTLIQYSKDYDKDPARTGVNIVALGRFNASPNAPEGGEGEKKEGDNNNQNQNQGDTPVSKDPNVTLSIFNPISLEDAIKRVCENIKAVYKVNVEDGVVEIAPSVQDLEDALQTEYFELDNKIEVSELLTGEGGNQTLHAKYFSTVPLPEGAYTALDPVAGRLIVTNTPENIAEMRKIFEKVNRPKPQILIQAKFVDVIMKDLEELGFQYTFSRQNSNIAYANTNDLNTFVYTGTESMTFDKSINIYTKDKENKNSDWYSFFSTASSLPYKTSDGYVIDPATGQVVEPGSTVNYYYQDAPLSRSSVSWGRNSKLTRVYDRDGTPTYEVSKDTNFGKMWEFDAYNNKGYGLNAQVYALDQAGASDMLYCPRITTVDGHPATLDMVITKYYPEDWDEPELTTMNNTPILVGSTPDLEEKEEGVFFTITPNLDLKEDPDFQTITLNFDQLEVRKFVGWDDYSYNLPTDDGTGNYVNIPNIVRTPIFQDRSVDTRIRCKDNSTIVIGGMVTDESSVFADKYPILGDIPLIGRLFQSKGRNTYKSNLLIFITCRMVLPDGSPFRSREDSGTITFKH